MADYNSDRTGSNIDLTLDKVDVRETVIDIGSNTANRITIDSSGTLLVGTTSTSWLTSAGHRIFNNGSTTSTVTSGVVGSFNRLTSDGEIFQFRKDGGKVGSIGANGDDLLVGNGITGLRFFDTEDRIIPRNTNGTTSDGATSLGGGAYRFKDLYLSGGVKGTNLTFSGNNGTNEHARIDSSGNLLVGKTAFLNAGQGVIIGGHSSNPVGMRWTRSSGTGTESALLFFDNSGNAIGSISTITTATSYNTSSDERLKENIQDTTHSVDIDDIQVREFDWKVDGSHQRYGFIAQELETVYPEAVTRPDSDDEMMSVDYSKLVPLLVKEIQQLKTRIEILESK